MVYYQNNTRDKKRQDAINKKEQTKRLTDKYRDDVTHIVIYRRNNSILTQASSAKLSDSDNKEELNRQGLVQARAGCGCRPMMVVAAVRLGARR